MAAVARLLFATGNPHKLTELNEAFPGREIDVIDTPGSPVEDGATYEENARIKARYGRRYAPPEDWAAGEDSGIEAVALDGRPGIESARWADDGVARMLRELEGRAERRARYVCAMVALSPAGEELVAVGTLDGSIADVARGTEGFGYDPIFVPAGETQTVAELGNAWKRRHSHRARAAAQLAARLGAPS